MKSSRTDDLVSLTINWIQNQPIDALLLLISWMNLNISDILLWIELAHSILVKLYLTCGMILRRF